MSIKENLHSKKGKKKEKENYNIKFLGKRCRDILRDRRLSLKWKFSPSFMMTLHKRVRDQISTAFQRTDSVTPNDFLVREVFSFVIAYLYSRK